MFAYCAMHLFPIFAPWTDSDFGVAFKPKNLFFSDALKVKEKILKFLK
jgi:hypothetical protein